MQVSVVQPASPWWAQPPLTALIVIVLSLPRLYLMARADLIGDEAYYAIWSLYPGFGYYDHPPVVAWTIALGRLLFGEGALQVRSLFLVSALLTSAALCRIGTLVTGDARVGAVAAIWYAVTPIAVVAFAVATPDGPSTLFWALTIWAIAEFCRGRNANWWLLAGAFAGLGLLSKYTVLFIGPGILLWLLLDRERRGWFRLWQVWAAGAIAVAAFAPVLWINAQRNWNSFRFQFGRSTLVQERGPNLIEFWRFPAEEAIQLLPTLFILVVVGLVVMAVRRRTLPKDLSLPVLTAAPMLVYFLAHAVFGRVNPNWTSPMLAMLTIAGAWAAVTIRPSRPFATWTLTLLRRLHVPLGVVLLGLVDYTVTTRTIPVLGPLPLINYVYGWSDLQTKLSTLAKAHGASWIQTFNYSMNGWLGYYGVIARDPLPVIETGEDFRYAYRPAADPSLIAASHLAIEEADASQPQRPLEYVTGRVTPLGFVTRDFGGMVMGSYAVYLVEPQ